MFHSRPYACQYTVVREWSCRTWLVCKHGTNFYVSMPNTVHSLWQYTVVTFGSLQLSILYRLVPLLVKSMRMKGLETWSNAQRYVTHATHISWPAVVCFWTANTATSENFHLPQSMFANGLQSYVIWYSWLLGNTDRAVTMSSSSYITTTFQGRSPRSWRKLANELPEQCRAKFKLVDSVVGVHRVVAYVRIDNRGIDHEVQNSWPPFKWSTRDRETCAFLIESVHASHSLSVLLDGHWEQHIAPWSIFLRSLNSYRLIRLESCA